MKYQNTVSLLDKTINQLSQFQTEKWVEVSDDSCETYRKNRQIKFKTTRSNLLDDYGDP